MPFTPPPDAGVDVAGTGAVGLLWAKWDSQQDRSGYALWAHLLDTGAVAAALVDEWLPGGLRRRLAEAVDGPLADVLVAAACAHDLGKASDVFQGQTLSPARKQFAGHLDVLAANGLAETGMARKARWAGDVDTVLMRRHEVASAALLNRSMDDAGASGLAAVVAGHHGRWNIPDGQHTIAHRHYERLLADPGWQAAHRHLTDLIRQACGVDVHTHVEVDPAFVPVLTGIVCLADWLASDLATRQVWTAGPGWPTDPAGYFTRRRRQACDHVDAVLGRPQRPDGSFAALYRLPDDAVPNEVQTRLSESRPGLRIVMVPTGDGKTEAALEAWRRHDDGRGLYFGMPTMATADVMFDRVSGFFDQAASTTLASLTHSHALLNDFYQQSAAELDTGEVDAGGDHEGGLAAGEWLQGRHRALLAPVSVGSADHALAGVLRHRFAFMRLLAAAGKTVVFDEVHSYDPYMAFLLERFLSWAGLLDIDVILLSATLPSRQLARYTAAYTGRTQQPGSAYPAITVATLDTPAETVELAQPTGRERTLTFDYAPGDLDALAVHVDDLVGRHPDAKIAVIVNTVARAQRLARLLADRRPDVLHARFPARLRAKHTAHVLEAYGKHAPKGGRLLIATQIVEQSIDLDADLLVTDLCPAPALLQRAGRLHRHKRRRPAGLDDPAVHVVTSQPPPDQPGAWLPYPAAQVLACWSHGLDHGQRRTLTVPDDVQQFIDATHVDLEDIAAETQTIPAALIEQHAIDQAQQQVAADRAAIPTPERLRRNPAAELSQLAGSEQHPERFDTRWMPLETARLLLVGQFDGAWRHPVPDRPDREQVIGLLGAVVSLSSAMARTAAALPICADRYGHTHPLLADLHVADLDDPNCPFILDPHVGLTARSFDADR